jgi:riboflavin synthase
VFLFGNGNKQKSKRENEMFTGLVETLGTVTQLHHADRSIKLCVVAKQADFIVNVGSSVSINGVCLTVESVSGPAMFFTAVDETIERTTISKAHAGDAVNLERAIPVGGRLDRHFVLGHVDAVGSIASDRKVGDSVVRSIRAPLGIIRLLAKKGSVAIDGISLTIADIAHDIMTISLIPKTLQTTTMGFKKAGAEVNIECDVLARYIERLIGPASHSDSPGLTDAGESLMDKLERLHY